MYIFTDGITEIKNSKGDMLESEGFKNYIKKYQQVPNHERLNKIVEDIIRSGRIQKDDLTIVVLMGNNFLFYVWYKQSNDFCCNHNYIIDVLGNFKRLQI